MWWMNNKAQSCFSCYCYYLLVVIWATNSVTKWTPLSLIYIYIYIYIYKHSHTHTHRFCYSLVNNYFNALHTYIHTYTGVQTDIYREINYILYRQNSGRSLNQTAPSDRDEQCIPVIWQWYVIAGNVLIQ